MDTSRLDHWVLWWLLNNLKGKLAVSIKIFKNEHGFFFLFLFIYFRESEYKYVRARGGDEGEGKRERTRLPAECGANHAGLHLTTLRSWLGWIQELDPWSAEHVFWPKKNSQNEVSKEIIKGMNKNLTTRKVSPVLLIYSLQNGNINVQLEEIQQLNYGTSILWDIIPTAKMTFQCIYIGMT